MELSSQDDIMRLPRDHVVKEPLHIENVKHGEVFA